MLHRRISGCFLVVVFFSSSSVLCTCHLSTPQYSSWAKSRTLRTLLEYLCLFPHIMVAVKVGGASQKSVVCGHHSDGSDFHLTSTLFYYPHTVILNEATSCGVCDLGHNPRQNGGCLTPMMMTVPVLFSLVEKLL